MDTYAIVTEKIVNLLQQGIVPWRRPWTSTGLPRNLVSKKPYRGVNLFLLSATKYVSPFWLTMKQANELGGTIRRGEHSQIVVFWKVDAIPGAETQTEAHTDEADEKSRRGFVLRYYRVFNLEQCALPEAVLGKLPKIAMHHHDPIEACERILTDMPNPPEIVHAGDKAFYSPINDRVTMPPRGLFESAEEYWSTFWHECGGHATGHPKRLNRNSICEAAPFGSPMYSLEELVAECSAAYLCAEAGISPAVIHNQAAYIQGWLATLHGNKRMVVVAAAQAQKAADYILNRENAAE